MNSKVINPLLIEYREDILNILNTKPRNIKVSNPIMPNFLVIGAPKAGTTSLNNYLAQHPEIFMSPVKNPAFFIWENQTRDFWGKNVVNSLDSYHSLFQDALNNQQIGETSPGYLPDYNAPARIKKHIPNVKLVAILRNPVERAISQFNFNHQIGVERFTNFGDAIACELDIIKNRSLSKGPSYIRGGFYFRQLSRYLDFFHPNQIKVFLFEDLNYNSQQVLNEIFAFLGVSQDFKPDTSLIYNKTNFIANLRIDYTERETLSHIYKEDIIKLENLIERNLTQWKSF